MSLVAFFFFFLPSNVLRIRDFKLIFYRLEYSAPESLPSPLTRILKETDSKADMWSLGMILHKLLFFKLPYRFLRSFGFFLYVFIDDGFFSFLFFYI